MVPRTRFERATLGFVGQYSDPVELTGRNLKTIRAFFADGRWCAQTNSNRRPLASEASALSELSYTRKNWQTVMDSNHRNAAVKVRHLAERVGFEPTGRLLHHGIANRYLGPLGHRSLIWLLRKDLNL